MLGGEVEKNHQQVRHGGSVRAALPQPLQQLRALPTHIAVKMATVAVKPQPGREASMVLHSRGSFGHSLEAAHCVQVGHGAAEPEERCTR